MKHHTFKILFISLIFIPFLSSYATSKWTDPNHPDFTVNWKDCSVYGTDVNGHPNRVWVEAQSWWQSNPEGTTIDHLGNPVDDFGHLHSGTCFPIGRNISGDLHIRLLVTVHDYDDKTQFDYISPHIFGIDTDGKVHNEIASYSLNLATSTTGSRMLSNGAIRTIINNSESGDNRRPYLKELCRIEGQEEDRTCQLGFEFIMNTDLSPVNGLQEFRFFVSIREPDGQEMHVSTSFMANIINSDKPISNRTNDPYIEGRGWYTGTNYIQSAIYNSNPYVPIDIKTFKPKVRINKGPTQGGIINKSIVHLNPNFHTGDPGTIVLDHSGPYEGEINLEPFENVLKDGVNNLVIVSESHCILSNTSSLDDCNCAFNVSTKGFDGDEIACTEENQVDFDNDSQKLSGLLVSSFVYEKPQVEKPIVNFELYSVVVSEPQSEESVATVKVVSNIPASEDIEVLYNTFAGTADHNVDYKYTSSDQGSNKAIIKAGESHTFINVPIIRNDEPEDNEYFFLKLNGALGENASVGPRFRTIVNIVECLVPND